MCKFATCVFYFVAFPRGRGESAVLPADLLASLFALWCGRHDDDGEEEEEEDVEDCGASAAAPGAVICEQLSKSAAEAVISGHRDKAIPLLRKRSETRIVVPRKHPGAAKRVGGGGGAGAALPLTSMTLDADDSEVKIHILLWYEIETGGVVC